jgi:hypothetical protein
MEVMSKMRLLQVILMLIAITGIAPCSYAGSDRLIMNMSAKRMDQENLVYVRFIGPDGNALESNVLSRMIIREQDCSSGKILRIIDDYKIGYAPESMLVGIYLFPQVWKNKNLCFSIPKLGKTERELNPAAHNGRSFQLNVSP